MKKKFYTIDSWCEHCSASLRSLQWRKFSNLILLCAKKFFAFSRKEVSQNHRSVWQRRTKLGKTPSRVLYFTVLNIWFWFWFLFWFCISDLLCKKRENWTLVYGELKYKVDMIKTSTIKNEGQTTVYYPDMSTTYNYIYGVWKLDGSQWKDDKNHPNLVERSTDI